MIMKGCVQWNPVYGWEDFASNGARTRAVKAAELPGLLLKLESWNLDYIWTMADCINGLKIGLIGHTVPFISVF